jgi:flagellar protein FliO/FliZ
MMKMTKSILLVAIAGFFLSAPLALAEDLTEISQVKVDRTDGDFRTELTLKTGEPISQVQATFIGDTLQIDLPQTTFPKGRHIIQLNGKTVKSVSVLQPDAETTRVRIAFNKGIAAGHFEKALRFTNQDHRLSIEIPNVAEAAKSENQVANEATKTYQVAAATASSSAAASGNDDETSKSTRLVAQADATDKSDKDARGASATAAPAQAATAAVGADASEASTPIDAVQKPQPKESEIPVVMDEKKDKKESSSPIQRVLITLGVLAALLGGATFALKKWAKKTEGKNKGTKIKVLTQHHLGPKKSLLIVQVAGESILVGVTDHNISMLKTLSLLDEEIPEETPRNFRAALNEYDEDDRAPQRTGRRDSGRDSEDDTDEFLTRGLSEIRDVVSTRLKNMRKF